MIDVKIQDSEGGDGKTNSEAEVKREQREVGNQRNNTATLTELPQNLPPFLVLFYILLWFKS